MLISLSMWSLDEAISFIRQLNLTANQFGYHLSLGGSVLIIGNSFHDVDIYAFPLNNSEVTPNENELIMNLKTNYNFEDRGDYKQTYAQLYQFRLTDGKAVDLFVIQE